jgi:Mg-chelatase subunit ChlD
MGLTSLRSRNNKGQIRIVEALITAFIVVMGLYAANYISTVYTGMESGDMQKVAQNIASVLNDPRLVGGVVDNRTGWKPELNQLIENLLPPDTYYTLSITSAMTGVVHGGLTNLPGEWDASTLDSVQAMQVVTVSLPMSKTDYTPLDVMLIMDCSGSMGYPLPGDTHAKLYAAKQAANAFVSMLNASRDRVGITYYQTTGHPATQLTSNFASIHNAINALSANGWTDMGDGIGSATQEFQTNGRGGNVIKVMILLSDGIANYPQPNPSDIYTYAHDYAYSKASEAANLPARIYTIGLGPKTGDQDHRIDEPLLQQIAASSQGGKYYYAPSGNDLADIYNRIAQDLMFSVKYDVVVLQLTVMKPR